MYKHFLLILMLLCVATAVQAACPNPGDLDATFNPSGTPPGTKLISFGGSQQR